MIHNYHSSQLSRRYGFTAEPIVVDKEPEDQLNGVSSHTGKMLASSPLKYNPDQDLEGML